ncbi:MAG: SWIM zinc finger family protein [Parachlamydiaceae bacterium]
MEYINKDKTSNLSNHKKKRIATENIEQSNPKRIIVNPIIIKGRAIAQTFWGKAWCENLEIFTDYQNRLARGRTYVRNKSIIDLKITKGEIQAQVIGTSIYQVCIHIKPIEELKWKAFVEKCRQTIESLNQLLQGTFSKDIEKIMTEKETGLFPRQDEFSMHCSCPDSTGMCKHIAAALYAVGASLDKNPASLFELIGADTSDLIFRRNGDAPISRDVDDHQISTDHHQLTPAEKEKNDGKQKRAKPQKFPDSKTIKGKKRGEQSKPVRGKGEFERPRRAASQDDFEQPKALRGKKGFGQSKPVRDKGKFGHAKTSKGKSGFSQSSGRRFANRAPRA